MIIFSDGIYRKISKGELAALAPGVMEGQGVFETMRVDAGMIQNKEAHLKRLHRGLKRFHINRTVSSAFLDKIKNVLLKKNKLKDARLRLSVLKKNRRVGLVCVVQKKGKSKASYRLCISPQPRPLNSRTHLKLIRYEFFRTALEKARTAGYDDVLFLNCHKKVVETSTANIFWIKNKILFTPAQSCGCLRGVMKEEVLRKARAQGFIIQKGAFPLSHLLRAEAVFLSNALIGLKPVSCIGPHRFEISKLLIA